MSSFRLNGPGSLELALPTDLQRLQGAWKSVEGRRNVQMIISGVHFKIRFNSQDVYEGTFRLDSTTLPRRMDAWIQKGPEEHRGRMSLCIYELESEMVLRWCAVEPGRNTRLSAFPDHGEKGVLHVVFERDLEFVDG